LDGTGEALLDGTGEALLDGTGEALLDGTGEALLDGTGEALLDGTGEALLDGTGEALLDGTGDASWSGLPGASLNVSWGGYQAFLPVAVKTIAPGQRLTRPAVIFIDRRSSDEFSSESAVSDARPGGKDASVYGKKQKR